MKIANEINCQKSLHFTKFSMYFEFFVVVFCLVNAQLCVCGASNMDKFVTGFEQHFNHTGSYQMKCYAQEHKRAC